MYNYAIKRTTDGLFWDGLWEKWVPRLSANCEFGTPVAVSDVWSYLSDEGHVVDIIRVNKGKAVT